MKAPGGDRRNAPDKQLTALWGLKSQVRFYKTTPRIEKVSEEYQLISCFNLFFSRATLLITNTTPQFQIHDAISASVALRKGMETGCSGNVGRFLWSPPGIFKSIFLLSIFFISFLGDFSLELVIF